VESLLKGLEALGGMQVARERVPANHRHHFLASAQDPLAPPARESFPGPGWIGYPQGPLPFLDHPDLLQPLLDGGAGRTGRDQTACK